MSAATRSRTILGVMGSGTAGYPELARHVGRLAAELGCHLLTGGGGGVMEEASRAFCQTPSRQGLSIGILKGRTTASERDGRVCLSHESSGANPWVELPIRTHLPLSGSRGREEGSRNHINVLSADVLVALPGGAGTLSEVTLRLDYGRDVILFLGEHRIDGQGAAQLLALARRPGQVSIARSPEELEALARRALREAEISRGAPEVSPSEPGGAV